MLTPEPHVPTGLALIGCVVVILLLVVGGVVGWSLAGIACGASRLLFR